MFDLVRYMAISPKVAKAGWPRLLHVFTVIFNEEGNIYKHVQVNNASNLASIVEYSLCRTSSMR